MILDDLTKGLKNKIEDIFSIKKSLSILDIPKQNLLEKGNIVILMNDKNKPIVVEFVKNGKYHLELKNTSFPKLLVESIINSSATKLFETLDFDEELDIDHHISYSDLTPIEKKDVKSFIKVAEDKLIKEHIRFGKMNDESLKKTISVQNGIFTVWMKEKGFNEPTKECVKIAINESLMRNDIQLRKRAMAAKCYHKIFLEKKNVGN